MNTSPSPCLSDEYLLPDSLIQAAMSVISVLDHLDRIYLRGSPIALSVLGATSAYYVAFSYGTGVIFLLLGKERTAQMFGNAANNPVVILVGIPLIPVFLVALEAYDLEGKILALWRDPISPWIKTVPIIGSTMEWIWPSPSREPHISSPEGLGGTIDYLARIVSAGLAFPFIAYIVGMTFFKSISQDHTKRILLGGIAFFSFKTLAKVYLRQQEYRRQGLRRVLDYQ